MSRKITISKYEGNTQWSVEVEDNYGKLHPLGYISNETIDEIKYLNYPNKVSQSTLIEQAEEVWENEVETKKQKAKFELSPTQLTNLNKVVLQNGKPLVSKNRRTV